MGVAWHRGANSSRQVGDAMQSRKRLLDQRSPKSNRTVQVLDQDGIHNMSYVAPRDDTWADNARLCNPRGLSAHRGTQILTRERCSPVVPTRRSLHEFDRVFLAAVGMCLGSALAQGTDDGAVRFVTAPSASEIKLTIDRSQLDYEILVEATKDAKTARVDSDRTGRSRSRDGHMQSLR